MSNTKRGKKPLLRVTSSSKTSSNISKARFVTIDAQYPSAEGSVAVGIVGEDTPQNEYASITLSGIEFIELQSNVTKESELTTGTEGRAKPKAAGDYSMGIALDSGDTDDIIRIKLHG